MSCLLKYKNNKKLEVINLERLVETQQAIGTSH